MVLPLIPIAIGLGVASLIGGIAVFKFNLGDKIKQRWSGKHITVLGSRGVGKTTFLHYLKTGKIQSNFEQTQLEEYKSFTFEVDGIKLHVKKGHDVGGSEISHRKWREQIKEADIVFYLINIAKILKKDTSYIKNVKADINSIKESIAERQKEISVFLIANHADECEEYNKDLKKFEEKVIKNQIIETVQIEFGGSNNCEIIIGSLKNTASAERLLKNILTSYQVG